MNWLEKQCRDAARDFKRLPKWQQKQLRYALRGNECKRCDGFGHVRQYEPSPQGGPDWISVGCTCECHAQGVYCHD